MRILNKKQKKRIDRWFDENWRGAGSVVPTDIPTELWEELEKMNDHETLSQNVNRYVLDKGLAKLHIDS